MKAALTLPVLDSQEAFLSLIPYHHHFLLLPFLRRFFRKHSAACQYMNLAFSFHVSRNEKNDATAFSASVFLFTRLCEIDAQWYISILQAPVSSSALAGVSSDDIYVVI